jgi:hypothetical protein
MGNMTGGTGTGKIPVNIRRREYTVRKIHIPYSQLEMIRVLQKGFDYEVKGTIYVDMDHQFKSFEVRTDNSATYSYGASDWRISFHTHPDKTAQKYGVRYYSPPSVDDVMEIYDHNLAYVPDTTQSGFGEISMIFANEGIYLLQVNRDNFAEFNKDNLPADGLEAILEGTLTDLLVNELKAGIREISGSSSINFDDPNISIEEFSKIVKDVSAKVTAHYGFNMTFYSWIELIAEGLTINICDYFLNRPVES